MVLPSRLDSSRRPDVASPTHERVVIVGSGPAGLTAAIYAARAALAPLVIEGEPSSTADQPGGQLMLTSEVENFPGFPDGVDGPTLMASMRAQAERFGARFVRERVTALELDPAGGRHRIHAAAVRTDGPAWTADTVIVSTGARALTLGLEAEERLFGSGISACATCDAWFFRGRHVAVVGGGDSAMEEATYLTHHAEKVTLIHRRSELRASKVMQDRARRNAKIDWRLDTEVLDVLGDTRVEGLVLGDTVTGERSTLAVDGLFIAIGHRPATDLLAGQVDLDADGYVRCAPGTTETSVPGVFACGDVADRRYRQAITPAGTGCAAALDAERYLAARY